MGASHKLDESDLLQMTTDEFNARYKVVAKVGSGAFADVLHLRDLVSKQDCALKVLQPSAPHPAGLQPEVALFREARALKHAQHPNVVGLSRVLRVPRQTKASGGSARLLRPSGSLLAPGSKAACADSNRSGSCWALVLEYVQGGSLSRIIYKQMVSPQARLYSDLDALTWATDIASGLAHLHSLNPCIIHRDLKLENILLQTPAAAGTGSAAARRLPTAKISDFGLHVMLDTPPCAYLLTTECGCPVLMFGTQQQTAVQHDSPVTSSASGHQASILAAFGGSSSSMVNAGSAKPCSSDCCSSNSSTHAAADSSMHAATASAAPAGREGILTSKASSSSPSASHKNDGKVTKHVMFDESCSSGGQQHWQQWQHRCSDVSSTCDQSRATADSSGSSNKQVVDTSSAALPGTQLQQDPQQQKHEEQWLPLTTNTLMRLSMDSKGSSCHSGRACSSVPVFLQPSNASRPGSVSGFSHASIPGSVLQRLSPSQAAAGDAAAAAAASPTSGGTNSALQTAVQGSGLRRGIQNSAAAGLASDDIGDILAAANEERDYLVRVPGHVASQGGWLQLRSLGSSSQQGTSSGPATPRAAAAAHDTGQPIVSDSCAKSVSGQSGDFHTTASVLWEDIIQDDGDEQHLLDPEGYTGSCRSSPLVYDLTQHTGSCMYMAPETFRGDPYNQSVDVFSFGVILYELFSRSLLLYTHTPANSPADCMKYAAQVASGFRPACPKAFHRGVWQVVERCWDPNPHARPSAAWVLQQLQQLLDAEEAAAAAKAETAGMKGVARAFSKGRELLSRNSSSLKALVRNSTRDRGDAAVVQDAVKTAAAADTGRQAEASDEHKESARTTAATATARPLVPLVIASEAGSSLTAVIGTSYSGDQKATGDSQAQIVTVAGGVAAVAAGPPCRHTQDVCDTKSARHQEPEHNGCTIC